MSSKLSSYVSPVAIRSTLFKNPTDSVPPTDELEALHGELTFLKQKTLERAKKAGEDLKTIEESMRRMKEKEKGKAKAKAVKREHYSDTDEPQLSEPLHIPPSKSRLGSLPVTSLQSSSARSSLDPRRSLAEDGKKKKKKRKRELDDSDIEHELLRPPKASPAPQPHIQPPPKVPKTAATSNLHSKLPPGPDFTVPSPFSLLPPRPVVPPPPTPGPSKPNEVMEDFSKAKPPTQLPYTTFYTSIDPWIRGIKEEDIGFLEYTADEVEPYIVPKLGRHYTEVWEEEDMNHYGGPMPGFATSRAGGHTSGSHASTSSAPTPKWDPSTLMEPDLLTEEKGHGPLTERLISALLPMPDISGWKGVKAAEDAMEGRPGGSGAAAARKEKMNVSDLEERIRDTMRFHGLLDKAPDYSNKVDDPIATALRHAQRELRTIVATNKVRKERLASIARDRLGYQEYLDLRDSIDKNISTTFAKLQKKDAPKLGKKKKKSDLNGTVVGATNVVLPTPCPAALGLGPDEENRLHVPESLKRLVETRRQWVDTVGGVFQQKQRENPGRIWLFPKQSIHEGIEEDIKREIETSMLVVQDSDSEQRTIKGKEKARGDDMDVG